DDLNLKKGLERVWDITKNNLLLIGISTVGVKWATGLIGFVLGMVGAAIGFAIGGGAAYLSGGAAAVGAVGIAVGVLVFFLFVVVASVISSYTSTAYHTCLYIWAREVERAREKGAEGRVTAPAPRRAARAGHGHHACVDGGGQFPRADCQRAGQIDGLAGVPAIPRRRPAARPPDPDRG
ncbi:MAG: hypothetical protein KJZ57_11535, partial [Anaerolineales bacterium]|nr:hypothetical protein [Anaerolineales bacterium]